MRLKNLTRITRAIATLLAIAFFCIGTAWGEEPPKDDKDNYLIGTADQLEWLANKTNTDGGTYNVKLTADIDYSGKTTMIGYDNSKPYTGTFDGQFHTITVKFETEIEGAALIRYIGDATVRDLRVIGNAKTTHYGGRAAGIAGFARGRGALSFINCETIVNIHDCNGDSHAGILGDAGTSNPLNIKNCVVRGSFKNLRDIGGIVGWNGDGYTRTLTNCFMVANSENINGSNSSSFIRRGNTGINNFYLTKISNSIQGVQKDAAYFKSKEAAEVLGDAWKQADPYPVFSKEYNADQVYQIRYKVEGSDDILGYAYDKKIIFPSVEYRIWDWYDEKTDGTKYETTSEVTQDIILYGRNERPHEFTLTQSSISPTLTYGQPYNYDLSTLLSKGAVANCGTMTYAVVADSSLPDGLTLDQSTGRISGSPTKTGNIVSEITVTAANTYSQKVSFTFIVKATPTFADTWDITGKTYDGNQISGITAPVLTGVNSETISTGIQLTYQIKDSGLDWGDTAPTNAGTYTVKASYAGDKNYNTAEKTAEFTIEKVVLTITPESDQILYKDEPILYTVSEGIIGQEKPLNDGKLGLEQVNGDSYKITLGTLGVNADDGKNYTISFSENIQATYFKQSAGDADVNLSEPPTGAGGWHTDKNGITFTAPKGFEIALTGSTELKSEPAYGESFIWNTEGEHEVAYNLRRIGTESVYSKSKTIKFDCTPPVHQDGSPAISNLQATFTLADAGSGIASFSYALDGNAEVEKTLADTPHEHSFSLTDKAGKHTLVLKATDVAGNTVTYPDIAFELGSPYVPPVAYYYTVTLPAVEGVTLSRKPGRYTVEDGYSFSFTLKLDAEYDKSVPIVTTTRGETIEPDKNGKYVIRNVEEDIDISITGIFRNDDPTANASIQGEVQVKALGHTLYIYTPKEEAVFIYTATGYLLKQQMVTGSTHIGGLPAGIYFVRIKERAYKVMIR